ncbi:MAG: hypothetical protein E7D33_00020 [Klebsiella sp.]|nr:hypothetical protein [Klebsiella sp.]
MIVRTWHGCVPLQHAEGFARHLEQTGVDHARGIPGYPDDDAFELLSDPYVFQHEVEAVSPL